VLKRTSALILLRIRLPFEGIYFMKGIKTESTTIEDVQDRIDKLVLGIFEAARGHNDVSTYQEKATTILSSYNQAIAAVNSLVGIEKTKEQQVYFAQKPSLLVMIVMRILRQVSF
jgi:hypothetical protein